MTTEAAGPGDKTVETIRRDLLAIGLERDLGSAPALGAYLKMLVRWNRTYNLTGARDADRIRIEHLLDCLSIVPALRRALPGGAPARLLDVGSGAGLPGAILAILHPVWRVDCIDAVGKKAAFIRQVAGQLNLPNLNAIHARVESIESSPGHTYDLITSRAFSSLRALVDLSRPLLKPDGIWMAMKGKVPTEELTELPDDVVILHVQKLAVPGSDAERCVIFLKPLYQGSQAE